MKPRSSRRPELDSPTDESAGAQRSLPFSIASDPPLLEYRLRHSSGGRSERLQLVREGDVLEVRAPQGMSRARIQEVLRARLTRLDRPSSLPALPSEWAEGTRFFFQGHECSIVLSGETLGLVSGNRLVLPLPRGAASSRIRDQVHAWLQREATRILPERLSCCADQLSRPLPVWTLMFSHQRLTRFDQGLMRLHWKLVLLAPEKIDAAILRELIAHPDLRPWGQTMDLFS